ncbi:hypothetical protein, partial [Sphingomonas sp.]|uniref:hypothetical protein n=1 Tax=Sphingomonas sp. TaxID=28214 RepID=UPI0031D01172
GGTALPINDHRNFRMGQHALRLAADTALASGFVRAPALEHAGLEGALILARQVAANPLRPATE